MRNLIAILVLAILVACSSSKEVTQTPVEAPKPNWISNKPTEGLYYSGIGMAIKAGSIDYLSVAKNNALNDLASEISVKINSTSVLYQVEQNEIFREEFKANTKVQSLENLEGFELVDTYENDREYWVYYRLSKLEFDRIKKERKQKALSKSLDLFEKAKEFKKNWEYDDALIYSIKAMESIKDYLGDPLSIEIDGNQVYYGNELYSFLNNTINEINISPLLDQIKVVRGNGISGEQLAFLVTSKDGNNLQGLPVFFYYSGNRIKNNELLSNSSGIVRYTLEKVASLNASETFQANLNMVHIAKEATEDPFISKMVSKLSGPEARVEIQIKQPSIYIKSTETSFGFEMDQKVLANSFKKEFLNAKFTIAHSPEEADYLLQITSETEKITSNSGFYSASLKADFNFFDNNLKLIYTNQLVNVRGVQLDYKKASSEAYKKAAEEIEKRIFRELRRKIFD